MKKSFKINNFTNNNSTIKTIEKSYNPIENNIIKKDTNNKPYFLPKKDIYISNSAMEIYNKNINYIWSSSNSIHYKKNSNSDFISLQRKNGENSIITSIEKNSSEQNTITYLIKSYFPSVSNYKLTNSEMSYYNNTTINEPVFKWNSNSIEIFLSYYVTPTTNLDNSTYLWRNIHTITENISRYTKKEIIVNSTRIYYPYMNSTILSNYIISKISEKKFTYFRDSIRKYCKINSNISSFNNYLNYFSEIKGIKIEVHGKVPSHNNIPRKTVKTYKIGAFNFQKYSINSNVSKNKQYKIFHFTDKNKSTSKNYLGAFTVKSIIYQESLVYSIKYLIN